MNDDREVNESFLLRLWDEQEDVPDVSRLCFHFPLMPPSLTGLNEPISRLEYSPPVLPSTSHAVTATSSAATAATATSPEIYVSYAWGEDSTEVGRQREEIVDRLCAAVGDAGYAIERDKERIRGGDSIERFALEMSKAERIITVISEKSLHSEYCMALELFQAFQRCTYQRGEFQEKIIAVVMDDAKPLIEDKSAILTLAETWQKRSEDLRARLNKVDPERKSPAWWITANMVDDMCPRLPDMLGALQDIVMKRGFEDITSDNFEEIIARLPPAR